MLETETKVKSIPEAFTILNDTRLDYCVIEGYYGLPQNVENKTIVILTSSRETIVRLWGLKKEGSGIYRMPVQGMPDQTVILYEKGTDRLLPETWETQLFRQSVIHNEAVKVPDTIMEIHLILWRKLFWTKPSPFKGGERVRMMDFVKERIGLPQKPRVAGNIEWNPSIK